MGEKIGIRASAVVINDNKLLLVRSKYDDDNKEFYLLPGGGVEDGESIRKAAEREVLEETGYEVKASDSIITYANEYVKNNDWKNRSLALFFKADLISKKHEIPPTNDGGKVKEVVWIELQHLKDFDVRPHGIVGSLVNLNNHKHGFYDLDIK